MFAFIVLFVSTFIISNTFSIVLGQRIRELSLLRAIGATPAQVRRSVLTESSLIGVAAAALGIGLGMLGALGMRGLFSALGAELPDGPLPLRLRTVIWAAALGIGLTVASSLLPAVKASRTPPIAGLAEGATGAAAPRQRWRSAAGGLLAGVGLLLTVGGGPARALGRAAVDAGAAPESVLHCESSDEAAARAAALVRDGDVVLVKGSRGVGTDLVVTRLCADRAAPMERD